MCFTKPSAFFSLSSSKLPITDYLNFDRMLVLFAAFSPSSLPTFTAPTPSPLSCTGSRGTGWGPAGWCWSCLAWLHGRSDLEQWLSGLCEGQGRWSHPPHSQAYREHDSGSLLSLRGWRGEWSRSSAQPRDVGRVDLTQTKAEGDEKK